MGEGGGESWLWTVEGVARILSWKWGTRSEGGFLLFPGLAVTLWGKDGAAAGRKLNPGRCGVGEGYPDSPPRNHPHFLPLLSLYPS